MIKLTSNTAFSSPSYREDIILRDRLFEKIDENFHKKVIAVIAPAGYGKTTLINSYVHKRKKLFAWVSFSPVSYSIYDFVTCLIQSFRILKPGFGEKIIKLSETANSTWDVGKSASAMANDFAILFTAEITLYFKEEIWFVLDDLQNLEIYNSPSVIIFIETLLQFQQSILKLVITSRSEPPLQLGKLRAKREVFTISTSELEFSEQETGALLEKFYPVSAVNNAASRINYLVNGWVTGIHIAMQSGFNISKDSDRLKHIINENLYNYFAEEIWSGLEPKLQSFLLRTSLLDEFTADSCKEIFDIEEPAKTIQILINRNVFISKRVTNIGNSFAAVYSYNGTFKDFLQNKIYDIEPVNVRNYLSSIARHYSKLKNFSMSIDFHIKAGEFRNAAELICKNFKEKSEVSDLERIRRWISVLPGEILSEYPYLLFLKAKAELYLNNDADSSISIINAALEVLDHSSQISEFVLLKAEALFNTNGIVELVKELEVLIITEDDPHHLININYLLGRAYYRFGPDGYEKAIQFFDEAIHLSDETGDAFLKADAFRFMGNLSQDSGDFEKSLFFRNNSIRFSVNVYQRMQTYNNIAGLLTLLGRYDEGYDKLVEMRKLFGNNPFSSLKRFLRKAEANFYYETGDYYKSLEAYNELIEIESGMNLLNFLWHNYLMRGLLFHYIGETDSALQNFDISISYLGENAKHETLILNQGKALCLLFRNAVKNFTDIESYLFAIYEFRSIHGEKVLRAQVSFYLACLYLRVGSIETAKSYFEQCFELSGERQITAFLERELRVSRDVFDFAVSQNSHKALVRQIYENVNEKLSYTWLSEPGRQKLSSDVENLTDIKMISFGRLEFLLRGDQVAEDKWIRKKSKAILAYLLSKQGSVLSKDMVIDLFFDDIPADKSDVVYHSTLYNIRTALRIYDIKTESKKRSKNKPFDYNPSYIIYEDKSLRLNPDFYYYSDNVLFEELYAKFRSPNYTKDDKLKAAESAIELYKGEFLPGYYDNWAEEMRINYKNIFCTLCEGLIRNFESAGNDDNLIRYSSLLIDQDKLNESAYIRLIGALVRSNELITAKSKFSTMIRIFNEELGEKPSSKTLQTIESLIGIINV